MISNYGIEDMCGVTWQWLLDQSYRFNGATDHTHQVTVSGDPQTVTSGNPSTDVAPTFSYRDLTSGKGQLIIQGINGDVKLMAGGSYNDRDIILKKLTIRILYGSRRGLRVVKQC